MINDIFGNILGAFAGSADAAYRQAEADRARARAEQARDAYRQRAMALNVPAARLAPKPSSPGPCRCGSSDFVSRPHGLTCTYCRRIR